MGFRADMRAAAVTLLTAYKAANPDTLRQIYPGRPQSIYPPTAFVDGFDESTILYTQGPRQRTPILEVVLIQGVYDSEEAVTLQDALVDGFLDYVTVNGKHAAGGHTLLTIARVVDEPNFSPDWIAGEPVFYYASRVGFAGLIQEGGLI